MSISRPFFNRPSPTVELRPSPIVELRPWQTPAVISLAVFILYEKHLADFEKLQYWGMPTVARGFYIIAVADRGSVVFACGDHCTIYMRS